MSNGLISLSSKQKKMAGGFVMGVVLVLGVTLYEIFPSASNQGFAPTQPIPFSHKTHAGVNKIDCQYCHVHAERSQHATIPSMNVCMNCHTVVKTDSPHIKKLTAAYKKGRAIEWIRVHELPDHVRFNHSPHVRKGLSCGTCHGDVANMEKVQQVASMDMGWCLDCHRNRAAPSKVVATVRPGKTPNDKHHEGPLAPFSCSTCHY